MSVANESGQKCIIHIFCRVSRNQNIFYVGYTDDLKRRLKQHNLGVSIHTNKFKPWRLRAYVAFDTEEKAKAFEQFLKTGNGRIFQKKFF